MNKSFWMTSLLFLACVGCVRPRPWGLPLGNVRQQQYDATFHDPFVDNEAAPEVVGVRPREYAKPAPEAVRKRPHWEMGWGR